MMIRDYNAGQHWEAKVDLFFATPHALNELLHLKQACAEGGGELESIRNATVGNVPSCFCCSLWLKASIQITSVPFALASLIIIPFPDG